MDYKILMTGIISLEYNEEEFDAFLCKSISQIKMNGTIEEYLNEDESKFCKMLLVITGVIIPGSFYSNTFSSVKTTISKDFSKKLSRSTQILLGYLEEERYILFGDIWQEGEKYVPILISYYRDIEIATYEVLEGEEEDVYFIPNHLN